MNYRSIIKEFDKAVVAETKRLTDIYRQILGEAQCASCCDKETSECDTQGVEASAEEQEPMKNEDVPVVDISAKDLFEEDAEEDAENAPVQNTQDADDASVEPVGDDTEGTVGDDTEGTGENLEEDGPGPMLSWDDFMGKKSDEQTGDDAQNDEDKQEKNPESDPKTDAAEEPTPEETTPEETKSEEPTDINEQDETANQTIVPEDPVEDTKPTEPTDEPEDQNESEGKQFEFQTNEGDEDGCQGDSNVCNQNECDTEDAETQELRESIEAIKLFTKASRRFNCVNG